MRTTCSVLAMFVIFGAFLGVADAADLKPIKTQKAKDLTVSLLSESGQWKQGRNDLVLTFTKDGQPVDPGKVSLNTSMPMPGMAPMVAGATLQPDGPGRYKGTITFADSGDRRVTVSWDGPAGKGATRFSVPVR
jgi:hypothetical protein